MRMDLPREERDDVELLRARLVQSSCTDSATTFAPNWGHSYRPVPMVPRAGADLAWRQWAVGKALLCVAVTALLASSCARVGDLPTTGGGSHPARGTEGRQSPSGVSMPRSPCGSGVRTLTGSPSSKRESGQGSGEGVGRASDQAPSPVAAEVASAWMSAELAFETAALTANPDEPSLVATTISPQLEWTRATAP